MSYCIATSSFLIPKAILLKRNLICLLDLNDFYKAYYLIYKAKYSIDMS